MPIPERQKVELLGGIEEARREPGRVQQSPEVVTRVREMRVRSVREAAGVDPAEDDLQPGREDVRNGGGRLLAGRLCRFGLARLEARLEREANALGQHGSRLHDQGVAGTDDLDGVLTPLWP